jgi:probable HAF family extracellular repeat protein
MPVYTYTTLDDPFAVGATTPALGINSTGQIVGNYRNFGGTHGFLYSGGTTLLSTILWPPESR